MVELEDDIIRGMQQIIRQGYHVHDLTNCILTEPIITDFQTQNIAGGLLLTQTMQLLSQNLLIIFIVIFPKIIILFDPSELVMISCDGLLIGFCFCQIAQDIFRLSQYCLSKRYCIL